MVAPTPKLRRSGSLADQAADELRARIIGGDIQLGEALSEIALAADLGVSKTPVREALLRLEAEGLVEIQPQRGTFVFQMQPTQVVQLGELRALIELGAARMAVERRCPALVAALDDILARMAAAMQRSDWTAYKVLDGEFHDAVIAHSGNDFLTACFSTFAFRIQALRARLSQSPDLNRRSFEQHQALVARIRSGDIAGALDLLSQHIATTTREFVDFLEVQAHKGAFTTPSSAVQSTR